MARSELSEGLLQKCRSLRQRQYRGNATSQSASQHDVEQNGPQLQSSRKDRMKDNTCRQLQLGPNLSRYGVEPRSSRDEAVFAAPRKKTIIQFDTQHLCTHTHYSSVTPFLVPSPVCSFRVCGMPCRNQRQCLPEKDAVTALCVLWLFALRGKMCCSRGSLAAEWTEWSSDPWTGWTPKLSRRRNVFKKKTPKESDPLTTDAAEHVKHWSQKKASGQLAARAPTEKFSQSSCDDTVMCCIFCHVQPLVAVTYTA